MIRIILKLDGQEHRIYAKKLEKIVIEKVESKVDICQKIPCPECNKWITVCIERR